jgi:LacI family transcriptional regulator
VRPSPSLPVPEILVLVDTSTTWGTEVIRGVDDYSQRESRWLLMVECRGAEEVVAVPPLWRGQGVIGRVTQLSLAKQLKRLKIPVVNVSWSEVPSFSFPRVTSNEVEVAQLAAKHLVERGFKHFAYCGVPRQSNYCDRCGPAFRAAIQGQGFDVHVFRPKQSGPRAWESVSIDAIQQWLLALPKPIGLLAWGPERGRNVIDACRAGGLPVPDEVAVVTTDDDELMCGISHPPLTAVDQRPRRVGYEAAALLNQIIKTGKAVPRQVFVSPQRVIARHSTDVLALEDQDIAQALRFIWQRFTSPLTVADIVDAVPLSRRALELRFAAATGRSPAAEIRRVRLQRAKELLESTDWSIEQVSRAAGFSCSEAMIRLFRREIGVTPGGYRQQLARQRDKAPR